MSRSSRRQRDAPYPAGPLTETVRWQGVEPLRRTGTKEGSPCPGVVTDRNGAADHRNRETTHRCDMPRRMPTGSRCRTLHTWEVSERKDSTVKFRQSLLKREPLAGSMRTGSPEPTEGGRFVQLRYPASGPETQEGRPGFPQEAWPAFAFARERNPVTVTPDGDELPAGRVPVGPARLPSLFPPHRILRTPSATSPGCP